MTASAESARGISPRAAHRTVREPLDSSDLCHRTKTAAFHWLSGSSRCRLTRSNGDDLPPSLHRHYPSAKANEQCAPHRSERSTQCQGAPRGAQGRMPYYEERLQLCRCYKADGGPPNCSLNSPSSSLVIEGGYQMDLTSCSAASRQTLHCALELSKSSWLLAIQFPDREQPSGWSDGRWPFTLLICSIDWYFGAEETPTLWRLQNGDFRVSSQEDELCATIIALSSGVLGSWYSAWVRWAEAAQVCCGTAMTNRRNSDGVPAASEEWAHALRDWAHVNTARGARIKRNKICAMAWPHTPWRIYAS